METSGPAWRSSAGASAQARTATLVFARRSCRDLGAQRVICPGPSGTDASFPAPVRPRAATPGWSETAPGEQLPAASLGTGWPVEGGAPDPCPAGREPGPGEGPRAVFGRFQDTCEHPGPGSRGGPRESARGPVGQPRRGQPRSLSLIVLTGI